MIYVAFSLARKRSKGRKDKLEGLMRPAGRILAMCALYDYRQEFLCELYLLIKRHEKSETIPKLTFKKVPKKQ